MVRSKPIVDVKWERRHYNELMYADRKVSQPPELINKKRIAQLDYVYNLQDPRAHKVAYSRYPLIDYIPKNIPDEYDLIQNNLPKMSDSLIVTEVGYHTMVYGPLGDLYAKKGLELWKRLMKITSKRIKPRTLELFTGTASLTASIILTGHNLEVTVDYDHWVLHLGKHNLDALGIDNHNEWLNQDALVFLSNYARDHRQVDIIYADPSWPGNRFHTPRKGKFRLRDMNPTGDEVVRMALKVSPIVALKARNDLDMDEVWRLKKELNSNVFVVTGVLPISEKRILKEKMIYFYRDLKSMISDIEETEIVLPELLIH